MSNSIEIGKWMGKDINDQMEKKELLEIIKHLSSEVAEFRPKFYAAFDRLSIKDKLEIGM